MTKIRQLQHLSLNTLYDVAYLCGKDYPVALYICTDTGGGKTTYAEALTAHERTGNIKYITGEYTPREYLKKLESKSDICRLVIADDIGKLNRKRIDEYFGHYMSLIDGKLFNAQYESHIDKSVNTSLVITSTLEQYYAFVNRMRPSGLLDRLMVLPMTLSDATKEMYEECILDERKPDIKIRLEDYELHAPNKALLRGLEPRLLRNVMNMARYLSDDQVKELIDIVNSESPIYSI